MNAKHSAKSVDHLTPDYVVDAARETLGHIDLDPASTEEANLLVKASRIFTKEDGGLKQSWVGNVFLNPPGGSFHKAQTVDMRLGYTKSRQALWWMKLVQEYEKANVQAAIFVGFSIEFLQVVQSLRCLRPTNFPMCVPRKRVSFDCWEPGRGRTPQKQPTHANVVVYLPDFEESIEAFRVAFAPLGEVFNLG